MAATKQKTMKNRAERDQTAFEEGLLAEELKMDEGAEEEFPNGDSTWFDRFRH